MVTGFEIVGAVSATLGMLNLAITLFQSLYKTIQEFRDAGKKLASLSDDFEIFQTRLEIWADYWNVQDETPDLLYIVWWTENGWRSIAKQLAAIDRTAEDFAKVLAKLIEPLELRKLDNDAQRMIMKINRNGSEEREVPGQSKKVIGPGLRAQRAEQTRILGSLAKEATTWDDKVRFVLTKSDKLAEYRDDLNERFNGLSKDAMDFFAMSHPSAELAASRDSRRRLAAASMLLQRALQTKAASEALYRSCLLPSERGETSDLIPNLGFKRNQLRLEIDLLLAETENRVISEGLLDSSTLHYHLLLSSSPSAGWREFLVEGPMKPSSGGNDQSSFWTTHSFEAACSALEIQQSCDFQAAPEDGTGTTLHFRISRPTDPIQDKQQKESQLWGFLAEIQNKLSAELHARFPQTERLDLAYRVAEYGLLLLGTSWLSNISSKKIQRIYRPARGHRRRYLMEAELSGAKHLSSVEPQTFLIGVLLTEIAAAQPILDIIRYEEPSGFEYDFVMAALRNGSVEKRKLRAYQVTQRVEESLGQRFSEAVEFCLQQSVKYRRPEWAHIKEFGTWQDRIDAYRGILEEYYAVVYTPLKELRDMSLR
ncbi:hypothetical protein MMC11_004694 [Xylographa trunciseda]|nr:hypothetical protein [Xylographa trunciseda]